MTYLRRGAASVLSRGSSLFFAPVNPQGRQEPHAGIEDSPNLFLVSWPKYTANIKILLSEGVEKPYSLFEAPEDNS
jgi:hypothetical protein